VTAAHVACSVLASSAGVNITPSSRSSCWIHFKMPPFSQGPQREEKVILKDVQHPHFLFAFSLNKGVPLYLASTSA